MYVYIFIHELIPPCDTRKGENVGALYSAVYVYDLLVVISRAYPRLLSCVPQNIYPACTCMYMLMAHEANY